MRWIWFELSLYPPLNSHSYLNVVITCDTVPCLLMVFCLKLHHVQLENWDPNLLRLFSLWMRLTSCWQIMIVLVSERSEGSIVTFRCKNSCLLRLSMAKHCWQQSIVIKRGNHFKQICFSTLKAMNLLEWHFSPLKSGAACGGM